MRHAGKPFQLFVIVHLQNPREKYWGVLQGNSQTGIWLTGIELKTLEEWINRWDVEHDQTPKLATTFFPMHRVEKVTVDESAGDILSMKEALLKRLGMEIDVLLPDSFHLPRDVF